jgi:type II secretory pathway component PulF
MQENELEQFCSLFACGIPLEKAIILSFAKSKNIMEKLQQGQSFSQIVSALPGRKSKTLCLLMQSMPLKEALDAGSRLEKSTGSLLENLVKNSMYPLVLLGAALMLVQFFDSMLLPSFGSWQSQDSVSLLVFLKILLIGSWCLIIAGFLFSAAGIFLPKVRIVYQIPFLGVFLRQIRSMQCAILIGVLHRQNGDFHSLIHTMQKFQTYPLARSSAKAWLLKMEKGKSFEQIVQEDSLQDPVWQSFMEQGLLCSNVSGCMERYCGFTAQKLESSCKKAAASLAVFSYVLIGILAVCMYQILLEPLNMISGF